MKKSIFIRTSLLILVATWGIVSCSDDFYTNEVRGKETTENYYKTDDQALEGILAGYLQLSATYSNLWQTPWTYRSLMSDEVHAAGATRGSHGTYEQINDYTLDADNAHSRKLFDFAYRGISRSNTVLENVEPDTNGKKVVIGEALFLRAYNYFDLVTIFGENIPLVTSNLKAGEFQQPAAEAGAIWAQIEQDLIDAIADLPLKSSYNQAMKFRANKGAAQALLGKAYLYQQKYDLAATQFDAVINSGEFSLINDFSKIWRKDQEFGNESLFELSYTESKGTTLGGYAWGNPLFNTDNILMLKCAADITKFGNMDILGQEPGFGAMLPTTVMPNAFLAEGDNVRMAGSVMAEADFLAAGMTFLQPTSPIYGYNGYIRMKLAQFLDEAGGPVITLNNGTNWRLIRYGDVLLMAAEANVLKSGPDFGKAKGFINQVRTRVQLANTTVADTDLMAAIIKERQLELAFEGYRFPDLVRWNTAGIISDSDLTSTLSDIASEITFRQPFNVAKHKLAPIPSLEINTNPNITQNPGY